MAQAVDHKIGWHRLPKVPGLAVLVGLRNILRRRNLYGTEGARTVDAPAVPPFEEQISAVPVA